MIFFTKAAYTQFGSLPCKQKIKITNSFFLKLMRIGIMTCFIFSATILLLSAAPLRSQTLDEVQVTLQLKNESLVNAFKKIEKQSLFIFIYSINDVKNIDKLEIPSSKNSIASFLKEMLKNTSLTYKQMDDRVLILNKSNLSPQVDPTLIKASDNIVKDITIRGQVKDTKGETLPGVSIKVKGTTTGTTTDIQGNYVLTVPDNSVIIFTYLGFVNQEITVGNSSIINIALVPDQTSLDEVVVVGYGTMKKGDLTGSIATVNGEAITKAGAFSAAQAMQGKLAGVQVTNNGDAGSESKIRIRGVKTIGNNDPLIVVDGITTGVSLNDINPSDIASIDVLKDASALAIFGSRASNGVILVTTKKGNYGSKSNITFEASMGLASIYKKLDMVSASELVDIIDEARRTENNSLGGKYLLYDQIFPGDNWARTDLTNWQDKLFRQGKTQSYAFGLNGGSDNTIYSFGLSYRDQEGITVGNYAKRITLNSTIETKLINDKLKIGGTINYNTNEQRGSSQSTAGGSAIFGALQTPSSTPEFLANGRPYQEIDAAKTAYIFPGANLINQVLLAEDYFNPNHKILNSIYADLRIIKGLNFKSLFGQSFSQNYSRTYNSQSLNPLGADASLTVNTGRMYTYSWDNTLTYDNLIGKHKINTLVGTNSYKSNFNLFTSSRQQFPGGDPLELRYLNFGNPATQTNGEDASSIGLSSYFGRINYSYGGKYLFTATVRRDGSSRFYKDVRWGTFPSISLGWNIADENFMKSVSWLDVLKLRTSWGQVGNQETGQSYAYISKVSSGVIGAAQAGGTDYIFGSGQVRSKGKTFTLRGNESLTWEVTNMTNVGIDMTSGNFSSTLEYFNNQTNDILLDSQFPDALGYTYGLNPITPKVNAGRVDTKGYEFNVNYNKGNGNFKFNIGLTGTYVNNKIISLGDREFISGANSQSYRNLTTIMSRAYVGDAIGSFYGWKVDGIFNSAEEVNNANQNARAKALAANPGLTPQNLAGIYYVSPKTGPGDFKFQDTNGDGIITDLDRVYLGNGNAKYMFGLNWSSEFKNFDFGLNIHAVTGINIHASLEPALSFPGAFNSLSSIRDHWTPTSLSQNSPRYTMSDPNNNYRPSDRWIYDGSFARIQNLILGYSFPKSLVSKLKVSRARVFMNVQNLYTLTSYPFYDPEVKGTSADGGNFDVNAGLDVGSAPLPRTFMFGLNFGF